MTSRLGIEPGQDEPGGQAATAVCVDFGSTWTKALHVDLATAEILGSASAPTSLPEVMHAYDDLLADLATQDARARTAQVLACSSAGGGLHIAVVGNEELVTAEAGRRVALSSGGKVVAVVATAGRASQEGLSAQLASTTPDLVLLTGGTDGGNSAPLLAGASALVAAGWSGPVVVAGDRHAASDVSAILARIPHVTCDNVVPKIGVLAPDSARAAVRELFLSHVIGGKGLSSRGDFAGIVRGATPDVVLTGAEVLAEVAEEDVVVVDVGGATTDVHSVVTQHAEEPGRTEVVAITPVTRTVEGDLGMRWSAPTTLEAADTSDPSLAESDHDTLTRAAQHRHDHPGWLPETAEDHRTDQLLARIAVETALRRHAGRSRVVLSPQGKVVERTGTDLRRVGLVVGSGGVLRHGRPGAADRILRWSSAGGWQLPEAPRRIVDSDYLLAAVGLLSGSHPATARKLAGALAARRYRVSGE